jgi:hypothetical protein
VRPGELVAHGLSVDYSAQAREIGVLWADIASTPTETADSRRAIGEIAAHHRAIDELYLVVLGYFPDEDCEHNVAKADAVVSALVDAGADPRRVHASACQHSDLGPGVMSRDGTLKLIGAGHPITARQQLDASGGP